MTENTNESVSAETGEAKAKRVYKCGVNYDLDSGRVDCHAFAEDGKTKVGAFTFMADDLPDPIKRQFMLHGISQKFTDGARTKPTPDERAETMRAMLEELQKGTWSERAPDGRLERILQALLAALREAGQEPDEAALREKLKSRAEQDKTIMHPKVAAQYAILYPPVSEGLLAGL